ncbi:hypothetical protein JTB14_032024, partial [Gonioctena quinquepunctata]
SSTKFANIYRNCSNSCHVKTPQPTKNGPKTNSNNTEDDPQQSSRKCEISGKPVKFYSCSSVRKSGMKFLRRTIFPQDNKRNGHVQLVMFSTSSSKYFYTSIINHSKNNNKKYFKSNKALENYKNALEQCMKIKFSKHRKDMTNNKMNWTSEPFKMNFPKELRLIAGNGKKDAESKQIKPEEKGPKQVLRLIPKKYLTVKDMARKKKILEHKKITPKINKKKVKIVYPSHIIKHKLRLPTPFHIGESARKKIEKYSNSRTEHKPKTEVKYNTIEVVPMKQELNKSVVNIINAIKKRREEICEQKAQTDQAIQRLIGQHPTVKKTTNTAKMSINKKYNVILLKGQAKIQLKMPKSKGPTQDTSAEEELRTEDRTNDTPVGNEKTKISENEKKLTMNTKSESDTQIVQHPVSSNSYRKFSEEILRYPKRIMGFKRESFDIDEICLKTKENYVAHVETTDNIKNIPNPQTILEEENTLSEQTSQEAHATIPVEKNIIDSKNTMRRLEEIMNRRMIQNEERNDKNVFHDENEMNIVYNPAQSLKEYLQKLNELKDQTAIDRLDIETQLTETSSMVEIMKGKNLNMNRKEKQNVENGIEVKENSTDTKPKIEETNRRYGKELSPLKCEDIIIEKRIKKALKTKRTQGIDSTESMTETTSFDSSGRTSDNTKINSKYKKPLYAKLLERNREQVSADERKKFEIVQDENLARKKSEAKRKVIISKHKPITKSPSNFSTTRTPKYLLENSSSDIKLRVPADDGETTESSRIKQKGDIQKILERYTIKNNTKSTINFKKPTEGKLEPKQIEKKNTATKHQYCLENNLSTDYIQIAKTSENHGKVYSMDGVRQEHISNISNLSAETSLNINGNTYNKGDVETNHTIENEKDLKIENYKRKLKNLLEPANQYLGKLKKARENRIKTLEQLKMQLKNQFSENIDSMELKNTLENIPAEKTNTEKNRVTSPKWLIMIPLIIQREQEL